MRPTRSGASASRAEAEGLVLYSLMAKLHCRSLAERMLIPAFIFFFRMLYPFAWVSSRRDRIAAAAGGCMLVRRDALDAAGGIESIRGALIDDCALARRLKPRGPIRLALTERARSIRPYPGIEPIRRMIARSAYAQLNFSPLLLAGTLVGMGLLYLAPPALGLFAAGSARMLGLAGWLAMAFAFRPTLAFYAFRALGPGHAGLAALYLLFTLNRPASTGSAAAASGKAAPRRRARRPHDDGERGELGQDPSRREFSVASRLIHPRHRPAILAFYRFVRAADDVADHANAGAGGETGAARPARCDADGPERWRARRRRAARGPGGTRSSRHATPRIC